MKWKVIENIHTVNGPRAIIVPINCFELKEENDVIASLAQNQKRIADEIVLRHNKVVEEITAAVSPAGLQRVPVRTMNKVRLPQGVDIHEVFPETRVAEAETKIGVETRIDKK